MTRAERIFAVVAAVALPLALALPPGLVELGVTLEVLVVIVAAVLAGEYLHRVGQSIARAASEYLWLLFRRNRRVQAAFVMLGALALTSGIPRALAYLGALPEGTAWVSRPWGLVWLAVALNLFAVGLIDDALTVRADRGIGAGAADVEVEP